MYFYLALYLLSGILIVFNIYIGMIFLSIVMLSCMIKLKSYRIAILGIIFVVIGYLILPSIQLPQLDSFNHEKRNKAPLHDFIEFKDDMVIDGDLFKSIAQQKSKTYQVYYTIKSKEEKDKILNNLPLFKKCEVYYDYSNPLPNTNSLKFNYKEYLIQQDIEGIIKIKQPFLKSCINSKLNLLEKLQFHREHLILNLKKLNSEYIEDIIALTLGETKYLSSERIEELKHLGIYHLYAVSGSHVALLSVFLFNILLKFKLRYHQAELIIFILLPIYAVLTGLSPSVIRAVAVVMLYLVIKKFTRLDSLQILSITFILSVMYKPFIIYDIGFQLSYLVSTFLLLTIPIIKTFHFIYKLICINLIAQISTFPILIMHFNTFQWLGLLTNFFFIPWFELILFPLVMIFLIIYVTIGFVPNILIYLTDLMLSITIDIIQIINNFNIEDIVVRNLSHISYFLIFIICVMISMYILKKKIFKAIIIFILVIITVTYDFKEDRVILRFLDVGQGDAMVSYHKDTNQIVMIDTGGKMLSNKKDWQIKDNELSYTKSVLIPELHEKGIRKIDYLIVSHPHLDHMGELEELSQKIKIKNLIINKRTWDNKELKLLISSLEQKGITIIDSVGLKNIKVGKAIYRFYNQDTKSHPDKNENSIITELEVYNKKIISTGDATQNNERTVLNKIDHQYDILKVGHHGSSTSSTEEFLSRVKPRLCIISAGRGNKYGLPKKVTIKKLQNHKCKILNTQDIGGITITLTKAGISTTNGLYDYNKSG